MAPTRAFLLGLPSATTERERATCLAGEALLGRRRTGTGSPVRLRSTATPPQPAPRHDELLRELLILRGERAGG